MRMIFIFFVQLLRGGLTFSGSSCPEGVKLQSHVDSFLIGLRFGLLNLLQPIFESLSWTLPSGDDMYRLSWLCFGMNLEDLEGLKDFTFGLCLSLMMCSCYFVPSFFTNLACFKAPRSSPNRLLQFGNVWKRLNSCREYRLDFIVIGKLHQLKDRVDESSRTAMCSFRCSNVFISFNFANFHVHIVLIIPPHSTSSVWYLTLADGLPQKIVGLCEASHVLRSGHASWQHLDAWARWAIDGRGCYNQWSSLWER